MQSVQVHDVVGVAKALFIHWNARVCLNSGNTTECEDAKQLLDVVAIASELAAGALEAFVSQPKLSFLGEDCSRLVARKLLETLRECHERGVFHRDVKPEVRQLVLLFSFTLTVKTCLQNMLVDATSFHVKLGDFGLAHMADVNVQGHSLSTQACGTRGFKAPEVNALGDALKQAQTDTTARDALRKSSFSQLAYDAASVDAWSATVSIFVLTTGHAPLGRAAPGDWFFDSISCASRCHRSLPPQPMWSKFWAAHEQWGSYSPAFQSFVQAGMHADPTQRASIAQLLQHPWLEGTDSAPAQRVLTAELARRAYALGFTPAPPVPATLHIVDLADESMPASPMAGGDPGVGCLTGFDSAADSEDEDVQLYLPSAAAAASAHSPVNAAHSIGFSV